MGWKWDLKHTRARAHVRVCVWLLELNWTTTQRPPRILLQLRVVTEQARCSLSPLVDSTLLFVFVFVLIVVVVCVCFSEGGEYHIFDTPYNISGLRKCVSCVRVCTSNSPAKPPNQNTSPSSARGGKKSRKRGGEGGVIVIAQLIWNQNLTSRVVFLNFNLRFGWVWEGRNKNKREGKDREKEWREKERKWGRAKSKIWKKNANYKTKNKKSSWVYFLSSSKIETKLRSDLENPNPGIKKIGGGNVIN